MADSQGRDQGSASISPEASIQPQLSTTQLPHHPRRRRSPPEDPFPRIQTTETPTLPTADLLPSPSPQPLPEQFTYRTNERYKPPDRYNPPFSPPEPIRPLRPIQDILSRITWDPSISRLHTTTTTTTSSSSQPPASTPLPVSGDEESTPPTASAYTYTVGYIDRFSGIQTTTLSQWTERRKDGTEGEDWIPLHRVMWVKRHWRHRHPKPNQQHDANEQQQAEDSDSSSSEEEFIWDRKRRIDRVFGSGDAVRNRIPDYNPKLAAKRLEEKKARIDAAIRAILGKGKEKEEEKEETETETPTTDIGK